MRSLANNGTHFENIIERQQLHQYSYCVRFLIVRIFAKCQSQILYELTKKIDSNLQPKIVETFYRGTCFSFIFLSFGVQNVIKFERKMNECKIQTLFLTA